MFNYIMKKELLGLLLIVVLVGVVSSLDFDRGVKKIEGVDCGYMEKGVYNFKVNEYKNYYAGGVLVHNKYDFKREYQWGVWGVEDDKIAEDIGNLINNPEMFPEELFPVGVERGEMLKDWNDFVKNAKIAGFPLSQWEFQGIGGTGESFGMHMILFGGSNNNIGGNYIPSFLRENVAFSWFLSQYAFPEIEVSWKFLENPHILLEKEPPYPEDLKAFDESNFLRELFEMDKIFK